jgi:DNA-binding NarL/FixJ family response regulator
MSLQASYARIGKSPFLTFIMADKKPLAKIPERLPIADAHMDRAVAIVAPQWLQDGLAVVIKAIPGVLLVACTGSIYILLTLDLERAPDLVVLAVEAPEIKAGDQIRQVRFVYPHTHLVVLIQEPAQSASAHAAGADETLLQGVSAEQFCTAISRFVRGDQVE